VTGPYQMDLVQVLSEKTHALEGKWLSSKINHIEEYMAGLIKVELDPSQVDALIGEFKSLPITVEYVELKRIPKEKPNHFNLSIDAKDRPGLVSDISQVLTENSVKVENMECNRIAAPGIGGTVFTSLFQIAVSDAFDQTQLIKSLQEISDDLVIDLMKVNLSL
ncbi:hypothetical protein N8878_08560, partial [Psychromonas sp.]|nr:hypothetical protein [Psychromonas sp.]